VRPEQKDGWLIRPYVPAQRERFRRALAASAADARDFPDLQIDVATDLRLQRLAETGISGERLWYLVEKQGDEAGCLLLADQPEWDRCELVYLGLEPSHRGRGVGRWLARHAVWQARQAGRSHLIAGVDAANDPAVAVYAAAGFVQAGRRHVFYRRLTSS
jgi:ribosomal protein S18 acetylase RimI-like enzyme